MAARTLTEDLHARLQADILAGRLPPGSRLKLAELAARYDATAGVVREALIRLTGQDLVRLRPQSGFTVTPLSRAALAELTEARTAIECLVFGRSVEHGDTRWEARVMAAHHVLAQTPLHSAGADGLNPMWDEAHLDFHRALLEGCPNARLREIADSLRVANELYRTWSQTLSGDAGRDVGAEHRELHDIALARDVDRATTGLEAHITRTAEILLRHATE